MKPTYSRVIGYFFIACLTFLAFSPARYGGQVHCMYDDFGRLIKSVAGDRQCLVYEDGAIVSLLTMCAAVRTKSPIAISNTEGATSNVTVQAVPVISKAMTPRLTSDKRATASAPETVLSRTAIFEVSNQKEDVITINDVYSRSVHLFQSPSLAGKGI